MENMIVNRISVVALGSRIIIADFLVVLFFFATVQLSQEIGPCQFLT